MNKLNSRAFPICCLLLACILSSGSAVQAQQSSERYIPIGYSPGISGKYSYIGPIVAVDRDAHTISIEERGERRVIRVTEATRIWLDRSKVRRENRDADYTDCAVGRMIEVMYESEDKNYANWIKIEAS